MTRPVVQLFVNDLAGSLSQPRVDALQRELEAAGARVIRTSTAAGALTVADEATHVCAVGGDGTLRHVVAAILQIGRPIPMSIFPSGTVNLLAREYGYGRDPADFVRRILTDSPPRQGRLAQIGNILMFTCASVGPDSAAVARLNPKYKRVIGRAAYGVAFLDVLIRWPHPQLRLKANGQTTACEAVYIAKGLYYAGPWSFAPQAAADDPLLHVVALRRARRRDFARFMWALLQRKDLSRDANLIRLSCDGLELEGKGAPPLQADGDIVATLPVNIVISGTPQAFV